MNLFLLSRSIKKLVEYHCDKHVVKMILETVQMLYTAHHTLQTNDRWKRRCHRYLTRHGAKNTQPYRKTHYNHPIAIWVRSHCNNYRFASRVALKLCREYTKRYGKVHACQPHARYLYNNPPTGFVEVRSEKSFYATKGLPKGTTAYPLAMPCEYHTDNAVVAYRNYYRGDKQSFARWQYSEQPRWYSIKN